VTGMTKDASGLFLAGAGLVANACDRFALTDAQHPVASGLDLWLLLALTATAARGEDREELQAVLGWPAGRPRRQRHMRHGC
jgi:hypothetical protein